MTEPTASAVSAERRQQPNVANLVKRISQDLQSRTSVVPSAAPHADVALRKGAGELRNRRAKVVFSYTPDNDDELRLEVNDIIEVLGEEEEGWLRGRIKGKDKEGVFPTNYVKFIDANEIVAAAAAAVPRAENRSDADEKTKSGESVDSTSGATPHDLIQPKKVHGIGFGNIFAGDSKLELRKPLGASSTTNNGEAKKVDALGVNKEMPVTKPVANGRKPFVPSSDAGHKAQEYAKALFAYEAENDDELTLKENDIIVILSKTCEDPGWWQGEVVATGKHGVFPDNFVEVMSADEVEKFKKSTTPPLVPAKPVKLVGPIRPVTPEAAKPERPPPPSADAHFKSSSVAYVKASSPGTSSTTASSEIVKEGGEKQYNQVKKALTMPLSLNSGKLKPSGVGPLTAPRSPTNPDEKVVKVDERDAVAPLDAERLTHPTALRPRNPNKRPPSHAFIKDMAPLTLDQVSETDGGDAPPLKSVAPLVPSSGLPSESAVKIRDVGGGDFVRRDEYERLRSEFEAFKREVGDRVKVLEKLANVGKNQKM